MTHQAILWRRLDQPGHEAARLWFDEISWHLAGTALFAHDQKPCLLDLDLNFSPSTNLLPLRRMALDIGQTAIVKAAWLRFPSFTLEPLDQVYRRLAVETYRYESAGGEFVRDLTVNPAGFVTSYPDFWALEAGYE